jgi:hypothetical protein
MARPYAGVYAAENIEGRGTRPMQGASLTFVSPRRLWSRDPGILDVYAYDLDSDQGRREHGGNIVPDPSCPFQAARTVRYLKPFEVSQQRIEMIDHNTLLVTPAEPAYRRHVLRRLKGQLFLN